MVDFRPFTGLEFDTRVAGDFGNLISPPYDVVDAELRQKLVARSRYNIVRMTLPEAEGALEKYAAAGELAKRWQAEGALVRTPAAFYVIEQRFSIHGRELTRTAICGQVKLSRWREEGIYPHEVTLPKPKADRLNLYRSTRMQHGPIFSLFEDAGSSIAGIVKKVKATPVHREAAGPEGSYDRVWRVTDAATLGALTKEFAKERFFIADGHHRYETSVAYRDEIARTKALPADHPANFVMMCAVPFDDPGLVILPTHRLLELGDWRDVQKGFHSADYVSVSEPGMHSIAQFEANEKGGKQEMFPEAEEYPSFYTYAAGILTVHYMKQGARKAFVKDAGELMAGLNVYEVLVKALPVFFTEVEEAIAQERIKYTHDEEDAIRWVDAGSNRVAILLSPITVRQMAAVAAAGRTMPPKSTYFYPKLPTGVVLKPLE